MSGYCEGCGNTAECVCGEMEITMTDNFLAENYIRKKVVRKLIEKWRSTKWEISDTESCADELEELITKT